MSSDETKDAQIVEFAVAAQFEALQLVEAMTVDLDAAWSLAADLGSGSGGSSE